MPEPTGSDLHIDTFLSNLSIAYMNELKNYVADKVFPVVTSKKQSDKYAIYNAYDWFRDEAKQRAPLTDGAGGSYGLETPGTFFCNEYSIFKDIADEDRDNADDVFDLDEESTDWVVEMLRISRERRWGTTYFGTGIWGTDLEGQSDAPGTDEFYVWDDATNSTPIEDVESAKRVVKVATGLMPNTFVVAERVFQSLKNHADVLDRYKYTQTGILTEGLIAKVFGVDNFYTAGAIYSPSPKGTDTMAYALDQYGALLVYVAPRPTKRRPSGGYTFRWDRPQFGDAGGDRLQSTIRKFDLGSKGGTRIRGSVYEDIKLVANGCGVFFNNCIAAGRTTIT